MGVRCFGQEQALSTYSKFKILLNNITVPIEAKAKTTAIIVFTKKCFGLRNGLLEH